jgi:hypothetical protein
MSLLGWIAATIGALGIVLGLLLASFPDRYWAWRVRTYGKTPLPYSTPPFLRMLGGFAVVAGLVLVLVSPGL